MAKILLAKDTQSASEFLTKALEAAGHHVDVVHDGLEALGKIQNDVYELMLTDIVLPGIDGVELVKRACDYSPQTKSMFIAGFAAVAISQTPPKAANERALKTRLSKPLHLRELASNVDQLIAA